MSGVAECLHLEVTIAFRRNGTRLHPNVWMEEICLSCEKVIDKKKVQRGTTDSYASKKP